MIEALSAARAYGGLGEVLRAAPTPTPEPGAAERGARAFAAVLDRADEAASGFATGAVDAQSVVEAMAQAEAALQTVITVRDRIVAAYQEVLRMPL